MGLLSKRWPPPLAALAMLLVLAACGSSSAPARSASATSPPAPSAPVTQAATPPPVATVENPIYGADLGIHVLSGRDSNDPVPDSEIRQLLSVLQGKTTWVRLYNVLAPWENAPRLAHEMGFKVAAAAYLNGDPTYAESAIAKLVDDVNKGYVDFAQAGSEAVQIKAVTAAQEVSYIQELKQKVHGKVPVGTAEPHTVLIAHPEIIRACDIVLANIAPISYAVQLPQSLDFIKTNYAKVVSLAGGVEVGIGETNWPSSGSGAYGSLAHEVTYVRDFETWARSKSLKAFFFEAFDEPYLAQYNDVGAHWGLWDAKLHLKPGLETIFLKP
jgi:exo-beta-1,3-glucanase (GH17 family)